MKLYLIAKGLREGTDVKKAVRLDRPRTLNEFLAIAKIYTGMKMSCKRTTSTNPGRKSLLLNPPKIPSMRKRRKAK